LALFALVPGIDLRFYVELGSDGAESGNVVTLRDRTVDSSPCGTGTCAEVALRYARGLLGLGEPFVAESFSGQTLTQYAYRPLGTKASYERRGAP
jgi:proline racemase